VSPVVNTIYTSYDLSYSPLYNHLSSLTYPSPGHHSNSCILSTGTQRHVQDPTSSQYHHVIMSSLTASFKPAFNNTRCSNIPELTHADYHDWKQVTILILSTLRTLGIITGINPDLLPLASNHDEAYNDLNTTKQRLHR
jgi:hypothetical protein